MDIYVSGKKAVLVFLLESVLQEIREQPEGTVSATLYATRDGRSITFSDEDTDGYPEGRVVIEEGG